MQPKYKEHVSTVHNPKNVLVFEIEEHLVIENLIQSTFYYIDVRGLSNCCSGSAFSLQMLSVGCLQDGCVG